MNFIDAHKIIYDYIDTVANCKESSIPARRISLLKNTKREIINAYKLFIAHVFGFNSCSQNEYEKISSIVYTLNLFVDDSIIAQLENCKTSMSDTSFIGKINRKRNADEAKKEYDDLSKRLINEIGPLGQNTELDSYTKSILKEAKSFKSQLAVIPNNNDKFRNQLLLINEYCCQVYAIANISMDDSDVEFFYPFDVLKYFARNPKLDDLFGRYKDYIFSNL